MRLPFLLPVCHSGIAHIPGWVAPNQTEEKTSWQWVRWHRAASNSFTGVSWILWDKMFKLLHDRNMAFFFCYKNKIISASWKGCGGGDWPLSPIPRHQLVHLHWSGFHFLLCVQMVSLWESCECYLRAVLLV